jgi:hypothetical protein
MTARGAESIALEAATHPAIPKQYCYLRDRDTGARLCIPPVLSAPLREGAVDFWRYEIREHATAAHAPIVDVAAGC